MANIIAQNIVDSVIQDMQSLTTNRIALYDYLDRIHQRILRESQWRFLLSDPQVFVTMPGVGSYTLVSGTTPAGSFQTANQLTNFANIAPGSVFNLTTWTKLEEDSDTQTTLNYIVLRDGSLRYGYPRTYQNSLTNPGTITLMPVPDDQNEYYPVPETPVVTYASGGNLPARIYYGVVTFVDSIGGESTQCVIPFTISIPANSLLTVSSPNQSIGGISGNQTQYSGWNVYIGYVLNNYTRQNAVPIAIGTNWTESTLGIDPGNLQLPSAVALVPSALQTSLSILATGQLGTSTTSSAVVPFLWALEDSNGGWWELYANTSGNILTTSVTPNASTTNVFRTLYLTDTTNVHTWAITVNTSGQLESTVYSTPPTTLAVNAQPPSSTTIQPLNAYVIQFRYYMTRNQITIENPTQVLQIPYAYNDIVIAGTNYLASLYIDQAANREPSVKTLAFKKDFDIGLSQIRRDIRVNYRKTDFISPDVASQYVVANQQGIPTMGW